MNDTMDSMYGSESIPLFGDTLLVGSAHCLALDDLFQAKQVDGATFLPTAPRGGEIDAGDFTYALPSPNSDWMSNKVDLSDFDFDNLFHVDEQTSPLALTNAEYDVKEPISPAGSYDSGVSSPGFSSSAGSPESSQSFCASPPPNALIFDNASDDVATLPYESSPSADADAVPCDPVTQALLSELGIEFLDNVDAPEVEIASSVAKSAPAPELQLLLTSSAQSAPVLVTPAQSEFVAKSKPGRKNKVISTQERKQRKRDQNKNAATRYRERKRQEQMERKNEETALMERNRTLSDKVNQISREIDYLKELMIEVYRIKGAIK